MEATVERRAALHAALGEPVRLAIVDELALSDLTPSVLGARFGLAGSAFIGIFFFFFPEQLLGIFGMTDPDAVSIGVQLLRVLSVSGLFISVALTYTGGLQGTGDTKSPLYISIISQVIIPLGICFGISEFGTLEPIHIWVAILAGHIARCTLSVIRFLQGKWRNIAIDIESTSA